MYHAKLSNTFGFCWVPIDDATTDGTTTDREKDALANAKLQQMVSGQNEAERRKGEAEILSTDLEKQNKRIAERRHQVISCFLSRFFFDD